MICCQRQRADCDLKHAEVDLHVLNLVGRVQVAGILLLLICSVRIWATGHVKGIFARQAEDDDNVPRMQASHCFNVPSAGPAEADCKTSVLAEKPERQDTNGKRFLIPDFRTCIGNCCV